MIKIEVISGLPRTVGYKRFTFPDGQPHIILDEEIINKSVQLVASITNPNELFNLLLIKDVLDTGGNRVHLHLDYLMGGRMDRHIDGKQPFTLAVVTKMIRAANFETITMLDPHSRVSTRLLGATHTLPYFDFTQFMAEFNSGDDLTIVSPDKGARERVEALVKGTKWETKPILECSKERDSQSGRLTGFKIDTPIGRQLPYSVAVIIDDICDGGGTFTGLADILHEKGFQYVYLFVTHGIFSKGRQIKGIYRSKSTSSYNPEPGGHE